MFCSVAFTTSVSRSTIFLRLRKVEFIKGINLRNVLFIGFVKFEKMPAMALGLPRTILRLALQSRWTADCSSVFFSEPFFKKETALSFFFLLDYASRTCSMLRRYTFVVIFFPIK